MNRSNKNQTIPIVTMKGSQTTNQGEYLLSYGSNRKAGNVKAKRKPGERGVGWKYLRNLSLKMENTGSK